MAKTSLNPDYVSEMRQMLREYYDVLMSRKRELEKEVDIYERVYLPYNIPFFGRAWYWEPVGTQIKAPPSIEDEIRFCREELKKWSVVG